MSFEANTGFLKADFVMSFVLSILGLIVLGTLGGNSYKSVVADKPKYCILMANVNTRTFHSSACTFAIFIGFCIAAGGIALFALDFITWKRSERFKGKRASVAALLISPIMCFFALSTSIVIGVGMKDFCKNLDYHPERCYEIIPEMAKLQAAVGGSAMAGILFACYGFSEYTQYRKRHIQGDKW
ncbi:hypothetical protein EMPS_02645 [Entomortierella parvispora]|uniref:Uncharacterized protein n=1 Tax=Entomortierella parvispora TaxID=205924 RepID=A0A9P3H539_9FUNG|nr:hypothetical protein EMPS_02645 [Entomortierella parvispora]